MITNGWELKHTRIQLTQQLAPIQCSSFDTPQRPSVRQHPCGIILRHTRDSKSTHAPPATNAACRTVAATTLKLKLKRTTTVQSPNERTNERTNEPTNSQPPHTRSLTRSLPRTHIQSKQQPQLRPPTHTLTDQLTSLVDVGTKCAPSESVIFHRRAAACAAACAAARAIPQKHCSRTSRMPHVDV